MSAPYGFCQASLCQIDRPTFVKAPTLKFSVNKKVPCCFISNISSGAKTAIM